jgi:hypothetical protein
MTLPFLLTVLFWKSEMSNRQQSLVGADGVLREVKARAAENEKPEPFKLLRAEASSLRTNMPKLSASESAHAWIGLVRDWETESGSQVWLAGEPVNAWADVMRAIPGPKSWTPIRAGLTELPPERTRSVIAMVDDLLGRDKDVLSYLESRRKPETDSANLDAASQEARIQNDAISRVEVPIALRSGNLDLVSKIYVARAARAESYFAGFPNVVGQFGRTKAEPLMRSMLEAAKSSFGEFESLAPLPKPPLYLLEASERSLANGTHRGNAPGASVIHEGPGPTLASVPELQEIIAIGRDNRP